MKNALLMSALCLFAATANANTPDYISQYTSVKVDQCTTVDAHFLHIEPEIDYYTGICPSFGGYVVEISGGDIRYNLSLHYNGTEINTPKPGAFHDMGADVIEWRFNTKTMNSAGLFDPSALIYRLNVAQYDAVTGLSSSKDQLVVVRLKKENSCVIGVIESQTNMNTLARELADNPYASCVL